MDELYTRIIPKQETALNEFMAGRLDDVELTRDNMKDYGDSERRTTTLESYTQKISFNSDRASLLSRQTTGVNKTILANLDFRKGLSCRSRQGSKGTFIQEILSERLTKYRRI